jgi:hypothetical protein
MKCFNKCNDIINVLNAHLYIVIIYASQVLQYHILGAPYPSTVVPKTGSISVDTLLNFHPAALTLSTSDNTVKVQGANNVAFVTVANIQAGLSTIHIIDAVLVPPLPQFTYPTIAAAATAYGLTTLVNVVSATPFLASVYEATTAITVLAPTNKVCDISDVKMSWFFVIAIFVFDPDLNIPRPLVLSSMLILQV